MRIAGALLMLIGALYHQVLWMPLVFAGGMIVLALGIERVIVAKLDSVLEKLGNQSIKKAITDYHKEKSRIQPDNTEDANKTNA